jgi:hypothetical protein
LPAGYLASVFSSCSSSPSSSASLSSLCSTDYFFSASSLGGASLVDTLSSYGSFTSFISTSFSASSYSASPSSSSLAADSDGGFDSFFSGAAAGA